ncbi:MAG: hypothetical protein GSR85_05330 [Desulfurococcales archaeon]|nr:hypothetical protein [Desulfurococcales archaeon]
MGYNSRGIRRGGSAYSPARIASRIFKDLTRLKSIRVYLSSEYVDTFIEVSGRMIKTSIPTSICTNPDKLESSISSVKRIKYIYPEVSSLGRLKAAIEDKKVTVVLSSIIQAAILISLFRLDQGSPILLVVLGVLLASVSLGDAIISSLISRDSEKRRGELEEIDKTSMLYPAYKTASLMLRDLILETVKASCAGKPKLLNVSGFILRLKRVEEGDARIYEYKVESVPSIARIIIGYT